MICSPSRKMLGHTAGRPRGARIWLIWAMVGAFAIVESAAWIVAGGVPRRPVVLVQVLAAWAVMLALAVIATGLIKSLSQRLSQRERAHEATLDEVEQLQTHNAMLETIARSADVTLAFQALATRIARLVPCDRVGLTLVVEDGKEVQTYTARVREEERRARPRPEVVFKLEGTAIGAVIRSRTSLLFDDVVEASGLYLDVSALQAAGFRSALMVPLVSGERAVGTLNVVSREPNSFTKEHIGVLLPIAELLAVACVAQRFQLSLGRIGTMEAMADLTLSIASEINGALQTIVGLCDLLERGYPDPGLQRDLATVVQQAQRIADLLERMRTDARERLKEAAETIAQQASSGPEAPAGVARD